VLRAGALSRWFEDFNPHHLNLFYKPLFVALKVGGGGNRRGAG